MTSVYIADAKRTERSALRLLLLDLKMEVVGEAADWSTTLTQVPVSRVDMLLIDWDLLPGEPATAARRTIPFAMQQRQSKLRLDTDAAHHFSFNGSEVRSGGALSQPFAPHPARRARGWC